LYVDLDAKRKKLNGKKNLGGAGGGGKFSKGVLLVKVAQDPTVSPHMGDVIVSMGENMGGGWHRGEGGLGGILSVEER